MKKAAPRYRIGELAEKAGVTPRTLRYYEDLGLLEPTERKASGFRYYGEEALARLQKIDAFKRLGLSLEEIAELIPHYNADPSGLTGKRATLAMLEKHLKETEAQLASLQTFRRDLQDGIARVKDYIRDLERKAKR